MVILINLHTSAYFMFWCYQSVPMFLGTVVTFLPMTKGQNTTNKKLTCRVSFRLNWYTISKAKKSWKTFEEKPRQTIKQQGMENFSNLGVFLQGRRQE